MGVNTAAYREIIQELQDRNVTLVAVSKTKPAEDIQALYDLGQRDFGENYVQELAEKAGQLPTDIRWHFIGHLQSNKVKYIAPFVYLVHGVDSFKLLQEINKQAAKNNRTIQCLLQVFIAKEETKFGLDADELETLLSLYKDSSMGHVQINGLMGMASFTDDTEIVRSEFNYLKKLYDKYSEVFSRPGPGVLSMGMSADYHVAIEEGSSLVRIGSLLFGARDAAH